jgi:hypothetical protein
MLRQIQKSISQPAIKFQVAVSVPLLYFKQNEAISVILPIESFISAFLAQVHFDCWRAGLHMAS